MKKVLIILLLYCTKVFPQYMGGNADGYHVGEDLTYVAFCTLPGTLNISLGGIADGFSFEDVASIKGAGNSNSSLNHSTLYKNPCLLKLSIVVGFIANGLPIAFAQNGNITKDNYIIYSSQKDKKIKNFKT